MKVLLPFNIVIVLCGRSPFANPSQSVENVGFEACPEPIPNADNCNAGDAITTGWILAKDGFDL